MKTRSPAPTTRDIAHRLIGDQPGGGLVGMINWCIDHAVAFPRDCWNPSGSFRGWLFEDGSAVRFSDMTGHWIAVQIEPNDSVVKGSPVPR